MQETNNAGVVTVDSSKRSFDFIFRSISRNLQNGMEGACVGSPDIPNDMIKEVRLLKGKIFNDDDVFE